MAFDQQHQIFAQHYPTSDIAPHQQYPTNHSHGFYQQDTEMGGSGGIATSFPAKQQQNNIFGQPSNVPEEMEEPLLQELGIDTSRIRAHALAILHPTQSSHARENLDDELAGPLLFSLMLIFVMMLQGKLGYNALYSVMVSSALLAFAIMSLLSDKTVSLISILSVCGYGLLPTVVFSFIVVIQRTLLSFAPLTFTLCLLSVIWSGQCASRSFRDAFGLEHMKYSLFFLTTLFYSCMITVILA